MTQFLLLVHASQSESFPATLLLQRTAPDCLKATRGP